jgi:serine protease Do
VQTADGQRIRTWVQFRNFIASQRPGSTVKLEVLRDGKTQNLSVTLGERTDAALAQMTPEQRGVFRNALVQPLDADTARQMGFEEVDSGLLVLRVQSGTDVDTGLQPGDVIIAAQGQQVSSLGELLAAERQAEQAGQALRLTIQRGENQELLVLK